MARNNTPRKSNRSGGVHNQHTVLVEGLPAIVQKAMLHDLFGGCGDITALKLNRSGPDCCCAYVSYGNRRDAEQAVKRCNGTKLCGATISVKLQHTEPPLVGQQQCTIKVSHIPPHVTEEDLKSIFSNAGVIKSVHKTAHGYAYVNYSSPEDADRAVHRYDGSNTFGGSNIISVKIKTPPTTTTVPILPASLLPSLPVQKAPTLPLAPSTSATIKVSVQGEKELNLTVEDLLLALHQYGTVTQHSEIKPGTPPYAYINFTTPEEARAACTLNGMTLKGHYIKIKVVDKQVISMDIREIPCHPLIGKLLLSVHESELQGIAVKLVANKIQISGKASEMDGIEKKVTSLIEKVEKDITKVTKSLPHFHLPSLGTPLLKYVIKKIERDHMVHIMVLNSSGKPLDVEDVMEQVFQMLHANPGDEVTETTHLSSFLHSVPPESFVVTQQSSATAIHVGYVSSGPPSHTPPHRNVWWWHEVEKHCYTPYEEQVSRQLTAQYLKEPHTPYVFQISTQYYKIDFNAMTQTNVVTGYKRKIKYHPPDGTIRQSKLAIPTTNLEAIELRTSRQPASQIRIEIQGIKVYLEAAFTNIRDELEKLVTESKLSIEPADQSTALRIVDRYCVEAALVAMGLVIKGNKEYVAKVTDKVRNGVQKERDKFLDQTVPDRHDHWIEKSMLALVDELSFEWRDVVPLLHKTLPDAKVTKLQRIQNDKQSETYAAAKRRMSTKNGVQNVNEKYLFYGTGDVPPEQIYNTTGYWSSSRFAVNASYSNKYAHRLGNERCLIVARVLTGRSCDDGFPGQMAEKPLTKPAHRGTSVSELYDSVTESTQGSVVYVINDHENAYPAYLVTYIV